MKKETIRARMRELAQALEYEYKCLKHLARAMYCQKEGEKNYANDAQATLGDTVLKLILAEHLFRAGLDKDEISRRKALLEKNATLKRINDSAGLYPYAYNDLFFASEAPKNQRLPYSAHDIYLEAIIGAIYLDRGLQYTRQWVLKFWQKHVPDLMDAAF